MSAAARFVEAAELSLYTTLELNELEFDGLVSVVTLLSREALELVGSTDEGRSNEEEEEDDDLLCVSADQEDASAATELPVSEFIFWVDNGDALGVCPCPDIVDSGDGLSGFNVVLSKLGFAAAEEVDGVVGAAGLVLDAEAGFVGDT